MADLFKIKDPNKIKMQLKEVLQLKVKPGELVLIREDGNQIGCTMADYKNLFIKSLNPELLEREVDSNYKIQKGQTTKNVMDEINLNQWYMCAGMKTEAGKQRIVPIHSNIKDLVKQNYEFAESIGSEFLFNDKGQTHAGSWAVTYDKYSNRFKKQLINSGLIQCIELTILVTLS